METCDLGIFEVFNYFESKIFNVRKNRQIIRTIIQMTIAMRSIFTITQLNIGNFYLELELEQPSGSQGIKLESANCMEIHMDKIERAIPAGRTAPKIGCVGRVFFSPTVN
jgi:hypothetical protein